MTRCEQQPVDFIIIGAMKCATSTLHEQLAAQPGIFMSEPKEPCFFSDDPIYARGMSWYSKLFDAAADSDLRGESSTHYTKLPTYPKTVERLHRHLPDARLIYVIRHPIDRLVSQYIHEWTERKVTEPIEEAIANLPTLIDYSRYAMQLQSYLETFGPERIQVIFFDHLISDPQDCLSHVARFIGYDGPVHWIDAEASNTSSERLRQNPLRDALVWNPIVTPIRRHLIPQAWRDRVKQWWQMREKPTPSETSIARLTAVFNEDLALLSQWLGLDLNCENFREVGQTTLPQWQAKGVPAPTTHAISAE